MSNVLQLEIMVQLLHHPEEFEGKIFSLPPSFFLFFFEFTFFSNFSFKFFRMVSLSNQDFVLRAYLISITLKKTPPMQIANTKFFKKFEMFSSAISFIFFKRV